MEMDYKKVLVVAAAIIVAQIVDQKFQLTAKVSNALHT
jgi:hypothetical protein